MDSQTDTAPEVKGSFTMGDLRTETFRVPTETDLVSEVSEIVVLVADGAYEWETSAGDLSDEDDDDFDYGVGGFTLRNALAMLVAHAIAYGKQEGYTEGHTDGYNAGAADEAAGDLDQ